MLSFGYLSDHTMDDIPRSGLKAIYQRATSTYLSDESSDKLEDQLYLYKYSWSVCLPKIHLSTDHGTPLSNSKRKNKILSLVQWKGWRAFNSCALSGKLKLWCFQFGLLPRLLWLVEVHTSGKGWEFHAALTEWDFIVKEYCSCECAKVRLEMTLVETHNKCVREANKSVVEAKAALQSGISWDMYSMEEGVLGSV